MGAAIFCGLALLCFVTGPLLARLEVLSPRAALGLLALAAGLGVVSTELGLVAVIQRRAEWPHYLGFLGLIPAGFVAVSMVVGLVKYPAINDISTDLEHPPAFSHARSLPGNEDRDMTFPEDFKAPIREKYPDLGPLALDVAPETAYERALELAKAQEGWTITHESPEEMTFEGLAVTSLLRFRDDFVVRVREHDGGAVIDMRSKSRKGKGDLGANAKRIRAFFAELKQSS